jgi:hypothetical protein
MASVPIDGRLDARHLLGEPDVFRQAQGTGSPGEPVEQLLVPLEEALRPRREVLIAPDPLHLGGQRFDNEGVDAGALDSGDRRECVDS